MITLTESPPNLHWRDWLQQLRAFMNRLRDTLWGAFGSFGAPPEPPDPLPVSIGFRVRAGEPTATASLTVIKPSDRP